MEQDAPGIDPCSLQNDRSCEIRRLPDLHLQTPHPRRVDRRKTEMDRKEDDIDQKDNFDRTKTDMDWPQTKLAREEKDLATLGWKAEMGWKQAELVRAQTELVRI